MFLFKTNNRKVYAQTAHGNIRKLSAGAKRIAVSLLVAEAHELTMKALEPTIFQTFVQFGYIHTEHTRLMKLFTMPSDYKYAKKDDVIQTLQATVLAAAQSHLPPLSLLHNPKRSSFPLLHSSVQITIHSEQTQRLVRCNLCAMVWCIRVHAVSGPRVQCIWGGSL